MMHPHTYLGLKVLHVASSTVFLGTMVLGLFWKAHADRSKNPVIIAHTMDGIIRSDAVFAIPALLVILFGGIATANSGRVAVQGTGWMLWSIVLFLIAGIAFGLRSLPFKPGCSPPPAGVEGRISTGRGINTSRAGGRYGESSRWRRRWWRSR